MTRDRALLSQPELIEHWESVFRSRLQPNAEAMGIKDFRKIVNGSEFFVRRLFSLMDQHKKGSVSLAEFLETMSSMATADESEKLLLLFNLYNIRGDDRLSESELEQVMRECLAENGMELPECDLHALVRAIVEEARTQCDHDYCDDQGEAFIDIDMLKNAFNSHPELIDNLNFMVSKLLEPPVDDIKRPRKSIFGRLKHVSTSAATSFRRELPVYIFLVLFFAVNVGVFVHRALHFTGMRGGINGDMPNIFYMISRACGRCLLIDTFVVITLVLRRFITYLRDLGASDFLPLDRHLYLHKIVGATVALLGILHSIMHLFNLSLNLQPDPVRHLAMNYRYFGMDKEQMLADNGTGHGFLGYTSPHGCYIDNSCVQKVMIDAGDSCEIEKCLPGSEHWPSWRWLVTSGPGLFGAIGGEAVPTGLVLLAIICIMSAGASPFVRRSSKLFEVFYLTHLLFWLYLIILFFHAPLGLPVVAVPLAAIIWEKSVLAWKTYVSKNNKSVILEGVPLSSRVTKLVIQRPPNFRFRAGDWVFVRIPKVARYEWHPFTISSAPEDLDVITLHIRGVGQWTNKVYDHYENERLQVEELVKEIRRKQMKRSDRRRVVGGHGHRHNRSLARDATTVDVNRTQRSSNVVNLSPLGPDKDILTAVNTNVVAPGRFFKHMRLNVYLEGPFGAPSSDIFRARHAVLVSTGIGVTPFSSLLQSVKARYLAARRKCPSCRHSWTDDLGGSLHNLQKLDFVWINRDQKSFEWFVSLLDQMEKEMQQGQENKFLDFHLFITKALQSTDMRAVALQLGMDLLHDKHKSDVITKLRVRTSPGRPNWDRELARLRDTSPVPPEDVTVFFCGNRSLAKVLKAKCATFGFKFKKEVFQ